MADTAPATVPIAFKKRAPKSSTARKRPATPPPASDSDSDGSSDDSTSGTRVKRRKTTGLTTASTNGQGHTTDLSKSTKVTADRSTAIAASSDATRSSTWFTDAGLQATSTGTSPQKSDLTPAASTSYIQPSTATTTSKASLGPVKAPPSNVRAIITTDFAPDVCKDYKQTGFCGFGDSCKFLHAREDYKQGWQLDKEWEKAGKKDKAGGKPKTGEDEDLDDEAKMLKDIPFKCIICKEDYKMPVVTKCGHYFCERCAMTRYMKEKKKGCAQCGKDTSGSFGVAKKLKELLERKKKREDEREADGGDVVPSAG
ncbi:RNA-splicing factor [Oleoguttula sp. CCFEE 5521]